MNRRLFLQSALTLGAGACLTGSMRAAGTSQRASVTDFGADLTGRKDSTEAVRKAIASLAPANARVVFPYGRYTFDAGSIPPGEAAMLFKGFDGIEIYANNAELHFSGASNAFEFISCHNVELHDMKLDWAGNGAVVKEASEADIRSFSFDQCEGVLLEGLTVQRAPGIAFAASNTRDLRLDSVTVAPDKESRVATSSGGHALTISDCHGDIHVHECRFEGMGGDGVNVHQSYWKIRERLDERTVVIESIYKKPIEKWQLPSAGSFVQFSSDDTLQLMGEIAIDSMTPNTQGATLKFSETLSPIILSGMLVCSVVDGPKVAIDHCRIGNNPGRGVVLHARSEVTNSHFTGCGSSAILLSADSRRMEGPVVQNINIRTNTFEGCGRDGEARGVITIDTAQDREHPETPTSAVNSGIKIQSNIFKASNGAAIYAAGVDGLLIDGNTFDAGVKGEAKGPLAPAVILRNVADADVTSNVASVPQSIVMVRCADTVGTDGNHLLTAEKTA